MNYMPPVDIIIEHYKMYNVYVYAEICTYRYAKLARTIASKRTSYVCIQSYICMYICI